MKKFILTLTALIMAFGLNTSSANAVLLNFDDINSFGIGATTTAIPENYGGFNWIGMGAKRFKYHSPGNSIFFSAENDIYNETAEITVSGDFPYFVLNSVRISSTYGNHGFHVQGYRDGSLVLEADVDVPVSDTFQFDEVNSPVMDRLVLQEYPEDEVFIGSANNQIFFDDFNYTPINEAPVPEPASGILALFAAGGGMFLKRNKSQK